MILIPKRYDEHSRQFIEAKFVKNLVKNALNKAVEWKLIKATDVNH